MVAVSGADELGAATKLTVSPELAAPSVNVRFEEVPLPTNVTGEEPSVENWTVPLETFETLTALYVPVELHPVSAIQPVLPLISILLDLSATCTPLEVVPAILIVPDEHDTLIPVAANASLPFVR